MSFVGPLLVLIVWMFSKPQAGRGGAVGRPRRRSSWIFTPGLRIGWQEILKVFLNAGRGMLEIAAITGLAGVVIGILQLTGLGFTLTLTLLNIGESNALLLLVLTAIVSMILGMGMPTTAVYVLLAVLVAPALQTGDRSYRGTSVYLLFRDAEHDHATGLSSKLCGCLHRKDRSVRTGWEGMRLAHRLCGAFSISLHLPCCLSVTGGR